jgi:hypothetical protein
MKTATSEIGTFATCRGTVTLSVYRGSADLAQTRADF